jgi:hypothetical protein
VSRWSFVIVAVLLSIGLYSSNAKSKAEFDTAFKQSNRDKETSAGKRYAREFEDKIFLAVASQAMQTCVSRSRDTVEPAMLVFMISGDGKIRRVLSTPGIEYGECIVSHLRLPMSVPRPPHDNFAVAVGAANHSHAQSKAPPDKPLRVK